MRPFTMADGRTALGALRTWPARRWGIAALAAIASTLLLALPAALIPNPIFGRAIPPEWWSWPVAIVTGALAGLLLATYVGRPEPSSEPDSASRAGVIGGLVSFFAVGCPVCNKVVLIALGATGAVQWFAPIQPILAVAGIALVLWALGRRLVGEVACDVRPATGASLGH